MDKNKDRNRKNAKFSKKLQSIGKVASLDSVRKKGKVNKTKRKTKNNVYYSFLTIVLLICLVQISFSAILNISKTISYRSKITQIQKIRDEAVNKNKRLKREISEFSATSSLEAIARNNLKMASDDEVLVIINDNKTEETTVKKKKRGIFNHDR